MTRNRQSRAFYDIVADDYDDIVGENSYVRELETLLAKRSGAIRRFLDVGAGTGHTVESVLVWVRPESVVAVDISAPMLAQLHAKFPHVEIVHADVLEYLERDPEPFDLITAFSVFELLEDFESVATTLAGNLRPNGILAFTYEPLLADHPAQARAETTYRDNLYEAEFTIFRRAPSEVVDWLQRAGLHLIAQRLLPREYERYDEGFVQLQFVAAQRPT